MPTFFGRTKSKNIVKNREIPPSYRPLGRDYVYTAEYRNISEGGVSPTGVFYPWARWGWGPGQIPELFVTRRRNRRIFLKKAKTVVDDETYLEKRLGIILDGNLHIFSLRIFLVFGKKIGFRTEEHFGPKMSYFELEQ